MRRKNNRLSNLEINVYLKIKKTPGLCQKQLARFFESDISVISPCIKVLETEELIMSDNGRPKRYTEIRK